MTYSSSSSSSLSSSTAEPGLEDSLETGLMPKTPNDKVFLLFRPWRSVCEANSMVIFEVRAVSPKIYPALGAAVSGLNSLCTEGRGCSGLACRTARGEKCHSNLWVTHFHSTKALSNSCLGAFIFISLTPGAKSQIWFLLTCLIFSGSPGILSCRTFSKWLLLKV